jgi:hypothetical protein
MQLVKDTHEHTGHFGEKRTVMGLHYRWSVDLCGPFPTSKAGNRYVMVMVEHYSKFVELAALPAKEARHTAAAFTSRVLGRYGAMAEVLTDQGSEWLAEFHQDFNVS